jgi:hypothetical protein
MKQHRFEPAALFMDIAFTVVQLYHNTFRAEGKKHIIYHHIVRAAVKKV